jgi:DNA repair photolyase
MRLKEDALCLFPEWTGREQERAGRNGARLSRTAAEAGAYREARRARYRPLACATVLNENANPGLPFRWTINPYRGCELGCSYCFARYTHGYLDHTDPESFESTIFVKFQAPQVLAETLRPEAVRGRPIALGTATDPYQPAEKRFRITQRLLEVLARCPDVDLSITTKSPLITRDIELLQKIARIGRLTVQITLITLNPALTRIVERRTPLPRLRLETIRAIHDAGIEVGLFVMPVMPGITDSPDDLRALLRAGEDAGAVYAVADPLRLIGPSRVIFEPVLRRRFPHLAERYRVLRSGNGSFPAEEAQAIRERFRALCSECGLRSAPSWAGNPLNHPAGSGWLFAEGR